MSEGKRIAFLSEHASPVALLGGEDAGGQNVYVDEVSTHLGQLGYKVDVFTRSGEPEAPNVVAWAPNVRVVNVKVGPPRFLLKDQLWPLMPDFRDAVGRFAAEQDIGYDLIHGNFWMSGWVAAGLRRRWAVPAVQIFHALGMTKRRHQGAADTSPRDRIAAELEVIAGVDRIIAQCPAERAELVDDYGADPERIVVVPSAVNVRRFRPVPRDEARGRVGVEPGDFVVVYVGRLLPRKDVANIVRALALLASRREASDVPLPRLKLLIVGGDSGEPDPAITPEIGALQELSASLGVADLLHFAGSHPADELRDYYSAGDVMVTTPWYEPFGLTPLEAMACGRPVIGAAVGGIAFTVLDKVTGYLVPPRHPEALANRLYHLLIHPELRQQMGRAARLRVERDFTWPTVAQRTAALYEAVLGREPALVAVQRNGASRRPTMLEERARGTD
jgi:glycosyltransferase involved in cell wall biosynthesis